FHVEKIRGEKDEEEADQQSGDAANDVRAVARHPSRQLAHQRHDQPLRRELRGIERWREALDPQQPMAEVELRQDLLRLAALHVLDERVRLLDDQQPDDGHRDDEQKGDGQEHHARRGRRAPVQALAHAREPSEGDGDDDGAEDDGGEKRPDDLQRSVQNGEGDDAEEDDAGEPPGAARRCDGRFAHTAISPRRAASTTASVRVTAPSFPRIPLTWNLTVWSVTPRREAISLLVMPPARSCSTSRSRRVSGAIMATAGRARRSSAWAKASSMTSSD